MYLVVNEYYDYYTTMFNNDNNSNNNNSGKRAGEGALRPEVHDLHGVQALQDDGGLIGMII